jgi:poly-beta-1,6-N-acetyl-D-glucosamine synthase
LIALEIVIWVIYIVYTTTILMLVFGWLKWKSRREASQEKDPSAYVSVVVAMRNESEHIELLLKHLIHQDYPSGRYEIILVNDHSTDNTLFLARQWSRDAFPAVKVIRNAQNESGKKIALEHGIKAAKGDLIITTDADCTMSKYWLRSMVTYHESTSSYMTLGPVMFKNYRRNAPDYFQALEFAALMGAAAGAVFLNLPVYCNAANMIFNRRIYLSLQDPMIKATASGDDTLLLLNVKKQYPGKITFNINRAALVETRPVKTWSGFWNQRKRWVSKSKYYRDFDILSLSFVVFITNLFLFSLMLAVIFSPVLLNFLIVAFLIKALVDLSLLFPVILHFKKIYLLLAYIPAQIIFPAYVTITALGGLSGKFHWKDRYYD